MALTNLPNTKERLDFYDKVIILSSTNPDAEGMTQAVATFTHRLDRDWLFIRHDVYHHMSTSQYSILEFINADQAKKAIALPDMAYNCPKQNIVLLATPALKFLPNILPNPQVPVVRLSVPSNDPKYYATYCCLFDHMRWQVDSRYLRDLNKIGHKEMKKVLEESKRLEVSLKETRIHLDVTKRHAEKAELEKGAYSAEVRKLRAEIAGKSPSPYGRLSAEGSTLATTSSAPPFGAGGTARPSTFVPATDTPTSTITPFTPQPFSAAASLAQHKTVSDTNAPDVAANAGPSIIASEQEDNKSKVFDAADPLGNSKLVEELDAAKKKIPKLELQVAKLTAILKNFDREIARLEKIDIDHRTEKKVWDTALKESRGAAESWKKKSDELDRRLKESKSELATSSKLLNGVPSYNQDHYKKPRVQGVLNGDAVSHLKVLPNGSLSSPLLDLPYLQQSSATYPLPKEFPEFVFPPELAPKHWVESSSRLLNALGNDKNPVGTELSQIALLSASLIKPALIPDELRDDPAWSGYMGNPTSDIVLYGELGGVRSNLKRGREGLLKDPSRIKRSRPEFDSLGNELKRPNMPRKPAAKRPTGENSNSIRNRGRWMPDRCMACRTRKKRCDKVMPVCGDCQKKGTKCEYGGRPGHAPGHSAMGMTLGGAAQPMMAGEEANQATGESNGAETREGSIGSGGVDAGPSEGAAPDGTANSGAENMDVDMPSSPDGSVSESVSEENEDLESEQDDDQDPSTLPAADVAYSMEPINK